MKLYTNHTDRKRDRKHPDDKLKLQVQGTDIQDKSSRFVMERKDMLKHQVCNSDTRSSKPQGDSQLFGLGFASGQQWSQMIQDNGLKNLDGPVQPSKTRQFPSNFTLFLAWMFLLMTVAALLAPISTSWNHERLNQPIEPEHSGLALPN